MNLNLIPKKLQHLIPLVKKWGINDDGYRDEKIEESTIENLLAFIETIEEHDLVQVNAWLMDEEEITKSTDEYINFTCFLMAYDYARAVVKSRNNESPI